MNKDKISEIVNDLYLFYRVFVSSHFTENQPAPHIKKLSRELMRLYEGTDESYKRLCVAMPPRHPCDCDTPVYTTKGWKKHGDLEVGDYVLSPKRRPIKVINVLPPVDVDNCFEFSNGDKIVSGDEHLWLFEDYNNNETRLFTTEEVMNRETFVGDSYLANFKIPFNKSKLISLVNKYKVKPRKGNCITVDSKDGIYLVGRHLTPTHNSKSSLITLAFPMWLIFHDPNQDILIITNSGSLSEKFGIQLREYIDEYGKYFNVYLSDVKKSSSYLMFCDKDGKLYNGSIRLVGKGGSITGTNADVLIIDDPYKGLDEEFTPTALEKMNNYYDTIIEQRLEPHSIEIVLHTRWRNNDIQGYLKQNDAESYKFIELPAILEDGTPLWKERYSIKDLEKKRERMGVRMFNAIYQQKPMDEDSDFFDLSKLKSGKPTHAKLVGKCRAWDIAASTDEQGDANDYTVGVLMELYDDNSVCITDIVRGQFGTYVKEIIKETAMFDGIDTHIVIETGVAGAGKLLYADWKEHLRGYIVEQALPVTSKEDRATPFKNAMLDGLVYIDVGDDVKKDFKLELGGFPFTLHDDQVDSASHGFNYLCRMDKGISPDLLYLDIF